MVAERLRNITGRGAGEGTQRSQVGQAVRNLVDPLRVGIGLPPPGYEPEEPARPGGSSPLPPPPPPPPLPRSTAGPPTASDPSPEEAPTEARSIGSG